MAFTFNNYATSELSKSPINDIISNLFGGYEQGVKASYLQPSLAQELEKSKLFNKYYGPNMESQIGLRGAQTKEAGARTGLLGEQTTQAHLQNQYLPEQLKAGMEAYKLQQQQNQMFNQMLAQRLQGGQGGQGIMGGQTMPQGGQDYSPGMGQAPMMDGQGSAFTQQMPQMPQAPMQSLPQGAPEMTNDDIINKKFFGMDTFTPKYKAWVDFQTKGMEKKQAEQFKLDAKQQYDDFKEIQAAQHDVPELENALKSAMQMKEIIENRPSFFGHTPWPLVGGLYNPADRFAKTASDPLVGTFQSKLIPQLAGMEQQLSNRGNQLALKTAASKLPSFEDSHQVAMGKVDGLIDEIMKRLQSSRERAGGFIKKIGDKRFKKVNGVWHKLEKGEY